MINPKPNDSHLNHAGDVASNALGTIRRFMKYGDMLTKDDLVLLHALADAAHNIPQMLSPSEIDVWTLESLQEDVLRCQTLMSKLNSRSNISTERQLFAHESNSSLKPFLQKLLDRASNWQKKWMRPIEVIFSFSVFFTFFFLLVHIHHIWNEPHILTFKEISSLEPEVKAFIKDKKLCNFVDKFTAGFSDANSPYTDKDIHNIRLCIDIGLNDGSIKQFDLLEAQVKAAVQ